MAVLQVLVIDDEAAIRQVLAAQIEAAGHEVFQADCAAKGLERLARGDIDVAVCDLRLPDFDGIELIRRARAEGCETGFLMITAFSSVDTAIEAMKAGAFDYLVKPLRGEDVLRRIEQIGNMMGLEAENRRLRSLVEGADKDDDHTVRSPAMREIERLTTKMARTDGTVLITGESGTGKGYIAKKIHERSDRAEKPFLSVNCGAIPENLLESEFFGHLKGSFTGADRAKKGLFVEANGGTLFLDEIGELPLSLQVKLLHVLEESAVRPVGSETSRRVDVRIIAATNRDINQMVADGLFREDLYYRLNILHLHMPPLRERREDIKPLIEYFIARQAERMGISEATVLDPAVEEILINYSWPGNVRQLQNVVARTLILAEGNRITLSDLPPEITRFEVAEFGLEELDSEDGTLRDQVRRFEVARIRHAINEAGGDRQAAAKRLGIGLSTLYRKLEESAETN
ncbi:MAG: sigma-54 dependent transcriptional regulator [Gammaproteobacteria bacterium]